MGGGGARVVLICITHGLFCFLWDDFVYVHFCKCRVASSDAKEGGCCTDLVCVSELFAVTHNAETINSDAKEGGCCTDLVCVSELFAVTHNAETINIHFVCNCVA